MQEMMKGFPQQRQWYFGTCNPNFREVYNALVNFLVNKPGFEDLANHTLHKLKPKMRELMQNVLVEKERANDLIQ